MRLTLVAPNYPESNTRFYNTNFRVLLIMQFNKVLITLSPTKSTNTTFSSSVSFTEPWHSKIYWAVRRWPILNGREFSKDSSSILYSVLLLIVIAYFHMNTEEPKLKGVSERRFGSMIFLLRIAGIPVKMKKVSTIYAVYMVTLTVCGYSTFIGMFVDVYLHWDDLGRAMKTLSVLIPFTNIMWIFSYCR